MHIVQGKIFLKENPDQDQEVSVYIRVLDTSRADAASVKVKETVLHLVQFSDIYMNGYPFKLQIDKIDPRRRYEVDVLIDLDNDGKTGKGDYISKQAYPVLTKGYPEYVEVEVSIV
jgi:hypothetical protein